MPVAPRGDQQTQEDQTDDDLAPGGLVGLEALGDDEYAGSPGADRDRGREKHPFSTIDPCPGRHSGQAVRDRLHPVAGAGAVDLGTGGSVEPGAVINRVDGRLDRGRRALAARRDGRGDDAEPVIAGGVDAVAGHRRERQDDRADYDRHGDGGDEGRTPHDPERSR